MGEPPEGKQADGQETGAEAATSILISKDRRVAIINDKMLGIGDKIDNATLVRLTRDSARLVRKGKVINLRLNNELIAIRKKAVESDL